MNDRYKSIIALPHHTSETRAKMKDIDRAAQFAPYSALNGYEESIVEEGRLTEREIELDEYEIEKLDRTLSRIAEEKTPVKVAITHFAKDPKKAGGKYITSIGYAERIDAYTKRVTLSSGDIIEMNKITDIKIF